MKLFHTVAPAAMVKVKGTKEVGAGVSDKAP